MLTIEGPTGVLLRVDDECALLPTLPEERREAGRQLVEALQLLMGLLGDEDFEAGDVQLVDGRRPVPTRPGLSVVSLGDPDQTPRPGGLRVVGGTEKDESEPSRPTDSGAP